MRYVKTFEEFVNNTDTEKVFESKIGELYTIAGEAKGSFDKFKKDALVFLKKTNSEVDWEDKETEDFLNTIFKDSKKFPDVISNLDEGVEYKESYKKVADLTEQLKGALSTLIDDLKKNVDTAPNTRAAETFVLQDVFDKFMEFRSLVGKTSQKLPETTNEKVSEDSLTVYKVYCRDSEQSIKKLIEYIGKNGNTGHSFSIVVDPDGDDDQKKMFGWDGDGSDYIDRVEIEQQPTNEDTQTLKSQENPIGSVVNIQGQKIKILAIQKSEMGSIIEFKGENEEGTEQTFRYDGGCSDYVSEKINNK